MKFKKKKIKINKIYKIIKILTNQTYNKKINLKKNFLNQENLKLI